MKKETAESYPVQIFMAGDLNVAEQVCREYCFDLGDCVAVSPTQYIYTGGQEAGFVVGFINYPRFPRTPIELTARAETLAIRLMDRLCQHSFTIQTPTETAWYSRRG